MFAKCLPCNWEATEALEELGSINLVVLVPHGQLSALGYYHDLKRMLKKKNYKCCRKPITQHWQQSYAEPVGGVLKQVLEIRTLAANWVCQFSGFNSVKFSGFKAGSGILLTILCGYHRHDEAPNVVLLFLTSIFRSQAHLHLSCYILNQAIPE